MACRALVVLIFCNFCAHATSKCGARWWKRLSDGLMLREAPAAPCPWLGGGSLWAELTIPTEDAAVTITAELERNGHVFFELQAASDDNLDVTVATRFSEAGRACATPRPQHEPVECPLYGPGADLRSSSETNGKKFCDHPEAKESRAFFCRYPPRFYGHAGICNQYTQFCPFQELQTEGDAARIDTAVVNVDHDLFHALEECGALKEEVWIFKVFVHWCPHCQQLMPRLYRLALVLRQQGVTKLRFGAVNCATEHKLCATQNWPGHPLLVARYLGPDRAVHDAIEHWVDVVKDAQLRQMLPRYALPGEFPLLKLLLEQLPASVVTKAMWSSLFESEAEEGSGEGTTACPNMTALHLSHPEAASEPVGNGWHDVESSFTPRRRWTDAMLMLRHIFQEWIAPLGDDGNVEAFSYRQVVVIEAWVGLLSSNLPAAFGLRRVLRDLQRSLAAILRAAQTQEGGRLCAPEWKAMAAPVLQAIAEVGQRDFSVASACAGDTCRLWSLFHTLAAEGWRQEGQPIEGEVLMEPGAMLQAVRGFVDQFFKCLYCRQHFLEQFDAGSYGLEVARKDRRDVVLYLWRLHNAVSVRVAAEHGCNAADRRWPPSSLCPACWDTSAAHDWPVLSETKAMEKGASSRAIQMQAVPQEEVVLQFLMDAFLERPHEQTEAIAGPEAATNSSVLGSEETKEENAETTAKPGLHDVQKEA
eukprot:TRINITY_DN108776_c0_g1_i1.p1 TRINITY_DN108776_c0_g1~~TRINITY_DN108776_c0_g1_i1.p1  ORF type:complete len:702 (-),score=140.65 TRINITY_DN108776_c0_g1_i1:36-2141(-)